MKPSYLSIRASVIVQIKTYCYERLPQEGYGILAGQTTEITHFFPVPCQNNWPCAYEFEPRAYLETIKKMRDKQLLWLGIVHSHPLTNAYPSTRDLTSWPFSDKSCWILSFKGSAHQLSAYYIQKNKVIPIMYRITGSNI
ncbi:M67 family metallopeptidase [Paenactinomyces guangxiensis]|uniref:M67 family metallopeptidase n=1 Tax=Paenactinomyces guangxiensis TaxID=1490290 RepID=A0A7W2A6P5_9BACL|nr:M67 family metallopeptidase [Paenactinomyces guangxiensis]MBA4493621.1 M67 family metallopeptidase [Paenactinomyces guangxiensis]MBH8590908.1 M67 family metallopeptidase [Paenactinomyces guangxiensis]